MAGTTLHSPHVLIFVSLYCYQFKVFTDCWGWGVATFRDQNTDIIVIISLSLAFYQFSSTLIYVLHSLLWLLHAWW